MSAREAREGAGKVGNYRLVRQRGRAGLFFVALAVTVLVGAAGIGLFPRTEGGSQTPASSLGASDLAILTVPESGAEGDSASALAAKAKALSDALPKSSGTGKRVVFSQSEQRVWLVKDNGTIDRTYLVSGSITDNLNAGTYAVESHIRNATAYDYESHMEYFVQFTSGKNAPIGFHDIPVSNAGSLLQTKAQLGTPLSSGCIRQERPDAIALWGFAPVGTKVVVLA